MASVGPADLDPSYGRQTTERMIMPARHGGAAFPMGPMRGPSRGARPPVEAHVRGAGMRTRRDVDEVPIYDRMTGRLIGYKTVSRSSYDRGYGMSDARSAKPATRAAAPRAREMDEYEPPIPSYTRGAADFAADDSFVDERYGRAEAPEMRRNMRGGAAQDFAEDDSMSFEHGGAAFDQDEREVDSILNNVKKTMLEQRRGRAAGRAAADDNGTFDPEERAPIAGRRGRADPADSHNITACVHGGCHTCLSRHPEDCRCGSCSARYAGRAAASSDAPAVRTQKPRTTTRGPRPQDF